MEIKDWPLTKRTVNSLLAFGYSTIHDISEKYIEDILEIPGIGNNAVREIREWCKAKYGVIFKKRPKPKVLKDYKSARRVVSHLTTKTKDWPKQLKIAEWMIDKYGLDLLLRVKPKENVWSLLWYKSDYGDKYIRQFMEILEVEKKEEKIVEFKDEVADFNISGPKTLKDFLKLGSGTV